MIKKLIVGSLMLLASTAGLTQYCRTKPQPVLHISLRDAILLSLRYNQTVQSAELNRVVQKFSLAVARNMFELQYNLTGGATGSQSMSNGIVPWNVSRNFNLTPNISLKTHYGTQLTFAMTNPLVWSTGQSGYIFNPSATFSLTHPILRGSGRLINEAPLIQAYNSEAVNKLGYKNTVMSDITTIITDYRNVVGQENSLIISQDALKSAKQTVANNKIRIQNGFMAPSENVQAEANAANQELQVVTTKNAVIQAKLQLLQDMGLSIDTQIEVDKTIETDNVTYPVGEQARCILLTHNISYLSALLNIRNTKLSVLQAEDSQRWQLDFNASFAQGPGGGSGPNAGFKSLFNGFNASRSVGLTFNIPIDNLPSQQGYVSAKVGYDQAKLSLKQLEISLEIQLNATLQNLDAAKQQIAIAKRAEDLANQSYQDSLKKLQYGKVSVFEVTTLQTNLVSAQSTYISNQINYLNQVATYQQNLGITLDVWNIRLKY